MWQKLYAPGERRGNTTYVVRGQDKWGKEYEIDLKTANERAAKSLARDYERERNSNPPPVVEVAPAEKPAEVRTFRLAVERYIEFRHPSKTDEARLTKLVAFKFEDGRVMGDTPIGDAGQDDMVTIARTLHQGCKSSTLNREVLRPFAAVVHYAANPLKWCADIKFRAFQEDEVERQPARAQDIALLIANCEQVYPSEHGIQKDKHAAHKMLLLLIMWERGLRISDYLKMKTADDIDLQSAKVRVTIGKARGKVKWLPISRAIVAMIANLPKIEGGYLFPWRTKSGVYKWLVPLCRKLDITFTPHMTRHAFATELLEADVDAKVVQELGGWSSYESIRRTYQHVREAVMRRADEARRNIDRG